MRVDREETRADIARRRLAQLAASFDAELPPSDDEPPMQRPRRRLEPQHVRVLTTLAVAASVLLVWWLLSNRPETTEPQAPLAFTTTATGPSAAAPTDDLVIDVVGKVRRPGIVTVPKGSRVFEAIDAAGGLKGRVDTTALNMARLLVDGEQLLVGLEPAVVPGAATAGDATTAKINLNTATVEQLDKLPGIGPVTAQSILSWRDENGRFASIDDLLDVKGIGDATLSELRDLVTV